MLDYRDSKDIRVKTSSKKIVDRRVSGNNIWLGFPDAPKKAASVAAPGREFSCNVLETEDAVGRAMFDELVAYAGETPGDITIILLGGRGAQAMYRLINTLAETDEIDGLLGRLHVFTQDALAPMRMANGLSFVRDFERLLGEDFFAKMKSFTPMLTDYQGCDGRSGKCIHRLSGKTEGHSAASISFFSGSARRPKRRRIFVISSPAAARRFQTLPESFRSSPSILEHHITKFKVGGSDVSEADEAECRNATYILTLGPAAILGAKRIVQSIVDASTAPAKRESFKRMTRNRTFRQTRRTAETA